MQQVSMKQYQSKFNTGGNDVRKMMDLDIDVFGSIQRQNNKKRIDQLSLEPDVGDMILQ